MATDQLARSLRALAGPPLGEADIDEVAIRRRARRIARRRGDGRTGAAVVLVAGAALIALTFRTDGERRMVQDASREASAAVDVATPGLTPALLDALRADDPRQVASLLAAGADPDRAEHYGIRPLMVAAMRGHLDNARLLLDAGAGVDLTNFYGSTALQLAARYDQPAMVRLLTQRGAAADQFRLDGARTTPLMRAAAAGDPEMLRAMIDSGADIRAVDADGRSVLHYALDGPDPAVAARILADAGATFTGANGASVRAAELPIDELLERLAGSDRSRGS